MATENLLADTLVGKSGNFTGALSDFDDSPDSPGTDWMLSAADKFVWTEVGFSTPSGNLTTGVGLQKFRIYVRRKGNNTDEMNVNLRVNENGTEVGNAGNNQCTSTTGEILEYTWDASLLSNIDGSQVEFRLQSNTRGTPADNIDLGGCDWVADYVTGTPPVLGFSAHGA